MKQQSFSMPSPAEMQALIEFCKVMANSPFYNKLGPGGVMSIFLTAKEYDLPFMACLNGGLHTFDGKVSFSAIMIDALILKAGHKTEVLHIDESKVTIRFIRGDRKGDKTYKPFEYTYTLEKAKKAGYLSKKNWQTSLDDMLYCRCLTGGGRKHIPEVFVGVLVAGELVGDDSDGDIQPMLPVNVAVPTTNLLPEPTKPVEAPKQIEHVPAEGYNEFVARHGLILNSDGTVPRKLEFVKKSAEKAKMQEVQVVNFAIRNEAEFDKKFTKWENENYPIEQGIEAPRSMDELAM
jgi:hypothetical protein